MYCTILSVTVMGLLALTTLAQDTPQVTFNGAGLSSLKFRGNELLKEGVPGTVAVTLDKVALDAQGYRKYTSEKPAVTAPQSTFDAATKTVRQQYSWGKVEYAYRERPDGLGITVTLVNAGDLNIADFEVPLLVLKLPSAPAALLDKGAMGSSLDNLITVEAPVGEGKLIACCETMYPPVRFGLGRPASRESAEFPLLLKGGVCAAEPGAYSVHPLGLPRVAAGQKLTVEFSLRLAAASVGSDEIIKDLYAAFRAYYKPRPAWKDNRPIGQLFLPGGGDGMSETNPRGWFNKKELDVSTAAGKAQLREMFLKVADQSVKVLKGMDAQGMILWDVEGDQNPHPITYIGDPRMIPKLDPEIDGFIDEYFQKFRDAGLKTGVCIRPTQVYYNQEKKAWAHGTGSDMPGRNEQFQDLRPKDLPAYQFFPIVERMSDKIAYAQKRWGCTIFYIDTNGIYQPFGEKGDFPWRLLQAEVWKRLAEKHPDVLLIPELLHGDGTYHTAYWAYCAQYMELDYGGVWRTPERIKRIFPDAISCVVMKDAKGYDQKRQDLVEAVRGGDILLFRGWFDDSINAKVKSVYEDAAKAARPARE